MPMARMMPSILLCAMLALPGCAGGPVLVTTQSACASLLPAEWRAGVAAAPLPDGDTVGDWVAFADAQTGRLDVANARTMDSIGIIERCEARDAQALKRSRPKVLGIF